LFFFFFFQVVSSCRWLALEGLSMDVCSVSMFDVC
jgi:hypothetical protein